MTTEDVLKTLRRACETAGSQREWARRNGTSGQYVHDVLNGRRDPGVGILKPLGLERVVTYRKVAEKRT
jgi:hypothetical protein